MVKKIYESILNNQITLFQVKKKYKMRFILELINEFSILKKKNVFLFSFCFSSSYCMKKLISFISGIDVDLLAKYFDPCIWFGKGNYNIDRNKYIDAVELIQKSPIIMGDSDMNNEDFLKYIFDDDNSELFIVDGIVELSKNSDCSIEEMFNRIRKITYGKKVIFVMDDIQYNDYLDFVDECFYIDNLNDEVNFVKKNS